ncbi:MAG TPA: amidophosphoribosyltransferase [Dehalococcoidia bacterium]|nr:amidophosphoribosyltransferase [Dehalococcoidia bacterium]
MQQHDGTPVDRSSAGAAVRTLPAMPALGSRPLPADLALAPAAATDELKEACGVFGVYLPEEQVARLTFYGLFALQHRGQESAGIATADKGSLHVRTGMGLVAQVFEEEDLAHLPGHLGIGHTRYSTTGSSRIANAQPIHTIGQRGEIALAHNGNLVNAPILRRQLEEQGHELTTSTDSELIARMLSMAPGFTWVERLRHVMRRIEGAYCLTILTPDKVIGVRDPMGNRPLCIGRLGGGWCIASETCALDHLGAEYVREVEPGEVVILDADGMHAEQAVESKQDAFCVFEYIYFSRPDSIIRDRRIYPMRMAMGAELANEYPVDADIVIGVPDSATAAAVGYARASGIPFAEGLMKNRYVGRTFIQPDQRLRETGVHLKFNPVREVLEGQRVVVVDDSIVRGTTTPRVVKMIRDAGAREIHLRICAPPIRHPCHFGVDMATRKELLAARISVEEIERVSGADSLGYLSLDGLIHATGMPRESFCLACFTGHYPVPVQLEFDKLTLEGTDYRQPALVAAGDADHPHDGVR